MKKFILTGCAAALFSIGTMAQVQDTASINNNLRQGAQETEQNVDSAGNELRDGAERTGNEIEQGAERTGDEIQQGAERTGEQIEQGAERTGNEIQQDADSTGDKLGNEINQGADRTGDQIQQGAEKTDESIKQGTDRPSEKMYDSGPSSQNNSATGSENAMGATGSAAPQTEIEVLEDKEGPNNQVVYKYQGGLYYVDKEEKKLVKIEESQLKDAEHKAVINSGVSGKQ